MNNAVEYTDVDCLLQLQNGNEQALAILMKRYYTSLYNYASRFSCNDELVKDCIQEVFISLWRNRQQANTIHSLGF